jgi:hypothetical protein
MSNIIARALATGDSIDQDAAINREVLLGAVMRQIFCQKTGTVLDIRTAVFTTITRDASNDSAAINVAVIVTGDAFDAMGGVEHAKATAATCGGTFEVIDGRDYTARGALTVKARKRIERAQ